MATSFSDSSQTPSQIDYKLRSVEAPRYKYVKVSISNQSVFPIPILATTSSLIEFRMPNSVYNLSRSFISYQLAIAAPVNAAGYNWTHEDVFDLGQSIQFGSTGGQPIVDLQWAQNFTKLNRKICSQLDDYMGNDEMSQLYRNNALAVNSVTAAPYNGAVASSVDPYLEPRYCKPALVAQQPSAAYRQYPLSAFHGTLLGVDRDFYGGGVEMTLRINAGTGDKMTFSALSNSDPAATAISTTGVGINNCYLYLAVEQNQSIIQSMMAMYASGQLKFRIPYTIAFRNVGGAAATQSTVQIGISSNYGKRLKKILHSVWDPVEAQNKAYSCDNWNGVTKVKTYQTFIDNVPLQDRVLDCRQAVALDCYSDDWIENKRFLERRSCILDQKMYQVNWFHQDCFFEARDKEGGLPEVNLDEGLELQQGGSVRNWQFTYTAGTMANIVHYSYLEFTRDLAIVPGQGAQFY
jgi:hypothetical protein